jgi:hypothetical protein
MPQKDPEKRREYTRKWQEANPDKVLAIRRKWREANRETVREAQPVTLWSCSLSRSAGLSFARGRLDRLYDFRIGGAAAQIAGEIIADAVKVWIGILVEQLLDHQHEAGRAEAALERAMLDECLLYGVEGAVLVERFDRFDPGAVGESGEIEAARHRAAVDDEGAATAEPLAAAFPCAIKAERITHDLQQGVMRRDGCGHRLAIEGEGDGPGGGRGHASPIRQFALAASACSANSGLSGIGLGRPAIAHSSPAF